MTGSRTVVCYAQERSEDSRFAQRLIDDLREAGVDAVTCENRQGIAMEEDLVTKLQESQWVILIQTPAALRSPQVQLAIDIALDLASQQRMNGVFSMVAVPHSLQDIPSAWTALKTFDASQDYPKALARLLLALNPVLSTSVPSVKMRAAPPPAFQPMMAEFPGPVMEPDDKPARFMPLWLRKKQLKSWLVPLSAVLALVLVAGVSMEVFAMIMHAHAQPVVAKKPVATMPVRVVTHPPVPTPTPNIASTPTLVPTQPPVAAQPLMPTPTPNIAAIAQNLYTNVMQQQPALTDTLTVQDGNNWDNTVGATGGCELSNNGYNLSALATGSGEVWAYCLAHSTNFSNFAYQVQMTYAVLQAQSPCGLVFRANGTDMHSSYRLYFGEDGSYELDGYQGAHLLNGNGVPINANTNQANTLTVIAKNNDIYIYANNQFIAHVADGAATSGSIGMVCKAPSGTVSQAGFQSAKVWTI